MKKSDRVTFILAKCEAKTAENRGYVDPGLFIYRGANNDIEIAFTTPGASPHSLR